MTKQTITNERCFVQKNFFIQPRIYQFQPVQRKLAIFSNIGSSLENTMTMENLLPTPVRPSEVLIGKIVPYIAVGYIQVALILLAAKFLFNVPMVGRIVSDRLFLENCAGDHWKR
jgi:hypothetical protein